MISIIIHSGKDFGGVERRYARLAAYINDIKIPVRICCTSDAYIVIKEYLQDTKFNNYFIFDNESNNSLVRSKINRILGLLKLFNLLELDKSQKVHLAMNPNLITTIYAIFNRFLPAYSLSFVDPTFEFIGNKNIKTLLYYYLSLKFASRVDCLSPNLYTFLSSRFSGLASRFKCAPCSFFKMPDKNFSSSTRDIDVLFLGRFSDEKGLDILREAVQILRSRFVAPIELHVCGMGVVSPNIAGALIYKSENPQSLLSRCKIFLSIQKYENYPSQSLLEAMSSGCAIIATDVGETRLLLDDESAILIEYDSNALAVAILTLLNNEKLRVNLASNAIVKSKTHTVDRYCKYFLNEIVI